MIAAKFEVEFLAEINHLHAVTVETSIHEIGRSSCVVAQSLKQNDRIAARAKTTLVHFDYALKKSRPIEGEVRVALEEHLQIE
jgi:acyl-CoA thioester hydrolase